MPHARINPSTMFDPRAYSLIVKSMGACQWHIAATAPLRPDGKLAGQDDMRAQAAAVMANLERTLAAVGARRDQVVRIKPYTTDMDRFRAEASPIVYGFFTGAPPASTLIGVRQLSDPRYLLEIEATAVDDRPAGGEAMGDHRRLPADRICAVGPGVYSQVVTSTGTHQGHLAGLVSQTADRRPVGEGDMRAQAECVMDNVRKSLDAVGATIDDVVRINVVTTDVDRYWAEAHPVVERCFRGAPPARTVMGVSRLAGPALLLEIEVTAIAPRPVEGSGPPSRLNPATPYAPRANAYAHVVTSTSATQWHLAGVASQRWDAATGTREVLGVNDMRARAEGTLASVERLLDAVGIGRTNVVRINLFTTDMARYLAEASPVLGEFFGAASPASTLVEITRLADPRLMLELEATAIADGG